MKQIIATISCLIVLGLALSGTVYAQANNEQQSCPNCPEKKATMENPGMIGGPGMMMGQPGMMMDTMGLSPEQQKGMLKMQMQLHKEIAPLKIDLETKEMELQELWMDEKPDVEKIVKKVSDINKIKGQIQEKEIRHQFEIFKTLKPAQQKMFRYRHGMGMGQGGKMMSPMMNQMMCPMMNPAGGMGGCCQ
jgi:Spy/CpxP family protein refolding chaperone